jgi:large subunit ribosomal protein L21
MPKSLIFYILPSGFWSSQLDFLENGGVFFESSAVLLFYSGHAIISADLFSVFFYQHLNSTMKIAVIQSGSQQFLVKEGEKIKVSKLAGEKDGVVSFDKVLLYSTDGESAEIGKPYLAGKKVEGKILRQARDKKVLVMKYHNKTRYRRKHGHRQDFTEVEIVKI